MPLSQRRDCERFHRRDFLAAGAAGFLGLGLADLLRLEARAGGEARRGRATSVILMWLAGGPSTIDMWDPKPEAPEEIRGEFKTVATAASGVRVTDQLPRMAKVMDRCAVVRSLQHNIPAHGPGTVYMATGNRPTPALDYPSLGSAAARLLPARPGVPPYIALGGLRQDGFAGGAGYLGPAYNPFEAEVGDGRNPGPRRIEGLSLPEALPLAELENRERLRGRLDARFKALDRADLPAGLDEFNRQALDILRSDRTGKAFDLEREPASVRDRYGRNPLGQAALTARRLVEAGVRFVTLGSGGWDTHAANFRALRGLLPPVDQALSALIGDLADRGLLGSTLVYCAGEFGRTPRVNGQGGRDHWSRAMAAVLAGGGVRGGVAYGSTDAHGLAPGAEPCSPDDVSATVFSALGFDPHHELLTSSGRPIKLFREGNILRGLLG
jgi:hypothetical protein